VLIWEDKRKPRGSSRFGSVVASSKRQQCSYFFSCKLVMLFIMKRLQGKDAVRSIIISRKGCNKRSDQTRLPVNPKQPYY
jgi:hypothetical protein